MLVEYRIKFENGGVTITQRVEGGSDAGGNQNEGVGPDGGGNQNEGVCPDSGGNQNEGVGPDGGGNQNEGVGPDGGGNAAGRVIAVVLGPVVVGTSGPASAPGEKITKRPVFGIDSVNKRE